jgi:Spy/CpxP family protein refolding chaperone
MKISRLTLLALGGAFVALSPVSSRADDTSATSAGTDDQRTQRIERFKEMMSQLNLSDDQKEKMKQIWADTTPGRDRRQQMMAVLTDDQKAQLRAMWAKRKAAAADGGT